ncbi:hypothetical protein TrST_g13768 [Triparma strigata]|uniref:Uncharacterized protein n=1 Tax=Triparma strigata TaxID=1606541 RepID=A0A9W7A2M8_9STRA|nr:hypothetical protein TrST_g13768 [Triparma strigata]
MYRIGDEEVGCNTKFEGLERVGRGGGGVDEVLAKYGNEFERQNFLRRVMEGEVEGEEVNGVLRGTLRRWNREEEGRVEKGGKKKDREDGIVITEEEISTLKPLSSACGVGDSNSLSTLYSLVLPSESENIDAYESMWDIVKVVYGEEATRNGMKGCREETGEEEWGVFEARSAVVRALAWADWIGVGM